MDIDITRLRHILAVARTRNFSRAAEELNITQPALSRSIAAFEQRYDLKLFDRSRSGVEPTAMGRLVIAEAEDLMRSARDLDQNLRLYARGEGGDLSIGLGPLLASLLLPSLGKLLLETRPGLRLHSSVRMPEQLVKELLEDRIELIFGNSWTIRDVPGLAISALGSIQMRVIVRGGHPLAGRQGLTWEYLRAFPVASASELPITGLTGDAGAFVCDNFHILRELVLQTDSIWLSSTAFAVSDMAEGRLVTLDLADFPPFESEVSLVHRQGRTISPSALIVVNHISSMLASVGAASEP